MVVEDPFFSLPVELVVLVLGCLDSPSLARFVMCTSQRMQSAYAPRVKEMTIPGERTLTSLCFLSPLVNLEALTLCEPHWAAFGQQYSYDSAAVLDCDVLGSLKHLKSLCMDIYASLDWSFLAQLRDLEVLMLSDQPAPNAVLKELSKLCELSVMLDDESDLSFLETYPSAQLKQLHLLSNVDNADLGKISRFTELTHLGLKFDEVPHTISDFLVSMPQLESLTLSFYSDERETLFALTSPLEHLPNLKHLEWIPYDQMIHLGIGDVLHDLPVGLHTLKMQSAEVLDLSFLDRLPQLRNLEISLGPVGDYTPLFRLQNLSNLWLKSFVDPNKNNNLPKSLEYLHLVDPRFSTRPPGPVFIDFDLPKLKILQIEAVESDVHIILSSDNLPNVEELNICRDVKQDFSWLGPFHNMKNLTIHSSEIPDFSFFEHLLHLETLAVLTDRLEDITFVQGLQNLSTLVIGPHVIQDFSVLHQLPNLKRFHLNTTGINDLSFFVELNDRIPLKELFLYGLSEETPLESLKKINNLDTFLVFFSPEALGTTRSVLDEILEEMQPRLFIPMN